MIGRALDSLIGVFAPTWGVNRIAARATMDQIANFGAGGKGGYAAGKLNRMTQFQIGSNLKENAQPAGDIERMRWQAWDLYRNNAYARKIVRTITSKVIGPGMVPAPTKKMPDGTADTAFSDRCKLLWDQLQTNFDFRGKPGMGGLDTVGIARTALKAVIIGGECLWQLDPITPKEQDDRGLPIPAVLRLVDAERLGQNNTMLMPQSLPDGHGMYRGIELDKNGKRVAYHLYSLPIGATVPIMADAQIVPADKMGHLFVEEDIDQLRGVTWFSAALIDTRDVGDYRYNELKSSAMAACVVMAIKRATGSTQIGLNVGAGQSSSDNDGNTVSRMQPGMIVETGKEGGIEGFNPARNGGNVESFAQFMVRGIAGSMPGVKSSTVTGDYRNSSFSSERSADNDCWPEMLEVQDWFASSFMQPVWEQILVAAVVAGFFEDLFSAEQFNANRQVYVDATWQGPIAKSINPKDDAESASLRVKGLLSSLQNEAAAVGEDWRANIAAVGEVYKLAAAAGVPRDVIDALYGIQVNEAITEDDTGDGKQSPKDNSEAKNAA